MDQNQPEPTIEDSIKQVMQTLPRVILNYLAQGRHTAFARDLMAKYGLRVEQGGVLEREIMLLLMGIENPNEFTHALAEEAQLDGTVINSVVKDVNDLIFVPLREEEEEKKGVAPAVAREPRVAVPPKEESAVDDVPFAPLPPKVVMPRQADDSSLVRSAAPRTSLNLLQDRALQVAPENLPGVMPGSLQAPPTLEFRKVEPRVEEPSPRLASTRVVSPITAYGDDPYREPIDEPLDEM